VSLGELVGGRVVEADDNMLIVEKGGRRFVVYARAEVECCWDPDTGEFNESCTPDWHVVLEAEETAGG